MRKVTILLTVSLVAVAFACGDSSNGEQLFPDSGAGDGSASQDSGGGGGDASNDVGSSGDSSSTRDATGDTGFPVTLDGGDEGGIPCVLGGTAETEPNDTIGQANALTKNQPMCGVIPVIADGGTDVDFFTFTLGATSTNMSINYTGNVSIKVTVEGQSVTLQPGASPTIPFMQGKKYTLEVHSFDGMRQNYQITLVES